MASIALHLKSHPKKPSQNLLKSTTFHFFSSSSSNNNNNNNNNDFSSYFSDIKSKLKHHSPPQQPPFHGGGDGGSNDPVKPYPFSTSLADIKAKLGQHEQQQQQQQQGEKGKFPSGFRSSGSNNEILKNLSEFRRRVAAGGAGGSSPPPSEIGGGERRGHAVSFQDIKESLSKLRVSVSENMGKNKINSMSFNNNLGGFRPQGPAMPDRGGGGNVLGGSALPMGVFGREIKEKEMKKGGGDGRGEVENWMRPYDVDELGKKLREFRPEKEGKKGGEFSVAELNERLKKVIENDEKEYSSRKGEPFVELRRSLQTMKSDAKLNANIVPLQGFDILGPGPPSFMLSPPKEHLVEKYFHPDNMSAAEKLKLELKKVRDEFKMHESDCGSTRVQIAQLTTEIHHLSSVLLKKDKHSRRGLQAKVQQRKKLLKYLRRTDWESYCFVLSKLGLRDNPDYKN